ncbi:uncharacterized protein LOC116402502 [Cucumis sativus]|uniref:uncharacterized protein LOC116402502 n=1 Tax=Cucumis sativus TaxID=3659 RepID=UPI0012F4C073|nr:uncharacterized protein LOC116402502 [Cucumis sativus]
MKGEEFDIYVTGSWNFVIWCHTALGYESSCNQIIVEVLRFSKIWTALSYTWDNAGHFIQVRRYRPTLPQINNEWYVDTCSTGVDNFMSFLSKNISRDEHSRLVVYASAVNLVRCILMLFKIFFD